MKHQIITQAADLSVLLRYLSGGYPSPRSSRITGWFAAVACLGTGAFLVRDLWRWTPVSGDDRSALVIGIVVTTIGAAVILYQTNTSYYFSESYIERRPPLGFMARRVAVEHIHEGYMELTQHGYVLELVPVEGPKLLIPLQGKLRNDFARLYTEIGTESLSDPVISARYRWPTYLTILLLVAIFVITAIASRAVECSRGDSSGRLTASTFEDGCADPPDCRWASSGRG